MDTVLCCCVHLVVDEYRCSSVLTVLQDLLRYLLYLLQKGSMWLRPNPLSGTAVACWGSLLCCLADVLRDLGRHASVQRGAVDPTQVISLLLQPCAPCRSHSREARAALVEQASPLMRDLPEVLKAVRAGYLFDRVGDGETKLEILSVEEEDFLTSA